VAIVPSSNVILAAVDELTVFTSEPMVVILPAIDDDAFTNVV
jgi:hypothetical protein